MPKQISRIDRTEGRLISLSLPPRKTMITKLTLACTLFVALFVNAHTTQAADLGIGLIPDDAAFLASTLRGREQYDRIVASNAFASLKELEVCRKSTRRTRQAADTTRQPNGDCNDDDADA